MKQAKVFKMTLASIGFVASFGASSGTITGGDLLTIAGANTLAGWLGYSDLNFTNISNLDVGSTAEKWHADVRGYTDVVSIYDVTYNNARYLIGGYSAIGHDGNGYRTSPENFIFNLTSNIYGGTRSEEWAKNYHQYDNTFYFATFGGGHDLSGGYNYPLGASPQSYGGYSYSWGYSYILGPTGLVGNNNDAFKYFQVNGLESYVFSEPLATPLPGTAPLMLSALGALAAIARRKKQVNHHAKTNLS